MSLHRALLIFLFGAVLLAGCGDDLDSPASPFGASPANGSLILTANGGAGIGGTVGNGGGAGWIEAICRGSVNIGLNPAPLPPPLPATPTKGATVTSWSGVKTMPSGNAIVSGNITASTPDIEATLNVPDGDLVINGTITVSAESNFIVNVSGTIFFNGTIRTGRLDGVADGDNGGNVHLFAQRIIFTGSVDTRGEDNPAGSGGWGGSVTFCTDGDTIAKNTGQTSQLYIGGSINLGGGNGAGPGARGGVGGNFQTSRNLYLPNNGGHYSGGADGVVHVSGTDFNVSGGSATGSGKIVGGSAGYMYWMADAGFFFNGTVVGNGGTALSTDGEASGGAGCALFVQEFTIGDSGPIAVYGTISISGGNVQGGNGAKVVGGHSGFMYLINGTDMNFGGGSISLRGGDSTARAGEAGWVSITIPSGPGDIYIDTDLDVSAGDGGTRQMVEAGGSVLLKTNLGDVLLAGSMTLNGGTGSGDAPTNGPARGGRLTVNAGKGDPNDAGSIILVGSIVANGGSDSNGADATNGASGGSVEFNCNNPAGSIYLDPGSSIQLDGGSGGSAVGGSGGVVTLRTSGGSVSAGTFGGNVHLRGSIAARGGSGGGAGGRVIVQSDGQMVTGADGQPTQAIPAGGGDGRAGHITLHEGATIDVSGGPGGGDGAGAAVVFDADGNNSNNPDENGIVRNLGLITARGGAPDGNGGGVRFDGLNEFLNVGPAPGSQDRSHGGTGFNGGFISE